MSGSHFDNFWSLASEFARRSERAAHTPVDEMKDPGWLLGTMGYEKYARLPLSAQRCLPLHALRHGLRIP